MKRTLLSTITFGLLTATLAASITLAAAPGGGGGGGRGGRGGGGGGGGAPAAARGPAPSLTPVTTPTAQPDNDGFLRRWIVLEPISAQGVTEAAIQTAVKKEYFPNQLTVIPKDGEKVTVDGNELTWHAYDSKNFDFSTYHFSFFMNKPTNNVLWWAVTIVNSPEEVKNARLAIGSNDCSVWWVNGKEVIGHYGDRPCIYDDAVSKKLTLKKGANVIRAAIHNQQGATGFCARFLDSNDKPITNITLTLDGSTVK